MARKIRLLTSISGSQFCFARGQEVTEPDEIEASEAQNLLDAGLAVVIEEEAPAKEPVIAEQPEAPEAPVDAAKPAKRKAANKAQAAA